MFNDLRNFTRIAKLSAFCKGFSLVLGVVVGAFGLSACGDDPVQSGDRRDVSDIELAAHDVKWLELSSQITPAQWMASKGEPKVRPTSDAEVQRIAAQLAVARKRYRESERMIANRSMQVSEMLQQIGQQDRAADVLDDLVGIGGQIGQAEGFGAMSQHYFNLRAALTSRADALASLKARYGAKT